MISNEKSDSGQREDKILPTQTEICHLQVWVEPSTTQKWVQTPGGSTGLGRGVLLWSDGKVWLYPSNE